MLFVAIELNHYFVQLLLSFYDKSVWLFGYFDGKAITYTHSRWIGIGVTIPLCHAIHSILSCFIVSSAERQIRLLCPPLKHRATKAVYAAWIQVLWDLSVSSGQHDSRGDGAADRADGRRVSAWCRADGVVMGYTGGTHGVHIEYTENTHPVGLLVVAGAAHGVGVVESYPRQKSRAEAK